MLGALKSVPGANIFFFARSAQAVQATYEHQLAQYDLRQHYPDCQYIPGADTVVLVAFNPTRNCIGEPAAALVRKTQAGLMKFPGLSLLPPDYVWRMLLNKVGIQR